MTSKRRGLRYGLARIVAAYGIAVLVGAIAINVGAPAWIGGAAIGLSAVGFLVAPAFLSLRASKQDEARK